MVGSQAGQAGAAGTPLRYRVEMPGPAFTVAVVGHRDFHAGVDTAELGASIASLTRELHARISAAGPASGTDCRLLTALAAGGDQLAVEAALSAPVWALHVVLPFAREAYRATLGQGLGDKQAQATDGFDRLLALATSRGDTARIFEIADWDLPTTEQALGGKARYWRDRRLRTLGDVLARQADLLLAVWDGQPTPPPDVTMDAVAAALRRGVPVIRIDPVTRELKLLTDDKGPKDPVALATAATGHHGLTEALLDQLRPIFEGVLQRPTENGEDHTAGSRQASITSFLGDQEAGVRPETAGRHSWWVVYAAFAWVFRFLGGGPTWPRLLQRVDQGGDSWLRRDHGGAVASRPGFVDEIDRGLEHTWKAADAIATARSHTYRSSYIMVFLGTVVAVWLGLAGVIDYQRKVLFVLMELLALVLLLVFFLAARGRNWHRRWLNARHVTESLRGTRFLAWLGFAGRRPIAHGSSWTAWLANAVMAGPGVPNGRITTGDLSAIAGELLDVHVADQEAYHKDNAERLRRLDSGLDRAGRVVLVAALMVAGAYVGVYGLWRPDPSQLPYDWPKEAVGRWVAVLCAGLPLLAGALTGIRYHGDFERFGERSDETAGQLEKIRARLTALKQRADDCRGQCASADEPLFEELVQIAFDLSHVYEADLEDWRFVYSARPNEAPG